VRARRNGSASSGVAGFDLFGESLSFGSFAALCKMRQQLGAIGGQTTLIWVEGESLLDNGSYASPAATIAVAGRAKSSTHLLQLAPALRA
jgi:hypothetical protein